ncbi:MAG: ATP-binding cassette domain-containing protein [Gammaproteobacteria bacterium]|nr:ATP-binding cassette domain-containing protein [Gammaproteobacteria bacterium]
MQPESQPLLAVNNIEVIYDHVILVLKGVSLEVPERGIVALLGANGAGKSTTLKAISNLLGAERGDVTKGSITFKGENVHSLTPNELVRRGVIQVMEGRVKRLNTDEGVTFLLAEQNTTMALRYATYGYILENGRVVMDGDASSLAENEDVKEFYLGVSGESRKSFRNVKAYRRRKRWLS